MADNEIRFVPDSAALEKAQERIAAGQEKVNKTFEEGVKVSREAAAEARRNEAAAERIRKANESGQERANRLIQEAERLHKKGFLTEQDFNRERAKQLQVIAELAEAEKKNSAEYQAAAEAKRKSDEQSKKRDNDRLARRRTLAKEESDLARKAAADLAQLQTPAQKYIEKLKEWKVALSQNIITQEQFNKLKDVELAKLNQVANASRKVANEVANTGAAGNGLEAALKGALVPLTSMLSVAGLLAAALRQANKEIANIQERQGQAAETQLEIAAAEREALDNLGIQKPEDADRLRGIVDSISDETGARRSAVYRSISSALNTAGVAASEEDAAEAVRAAAKMQPDDEKAISELAIGYLAQKKRNPEASMEGIVGFQMSVQETSPAKDNKYFSSNVAPTIPQIQSYGDTEREAAALVNTIATQMGDNEGAPSATAALQFAKQLQAARPDLGSTRERMEAIRADEKLRRHFLGALDPTALDAHDAIKKGKKGKLTGEAKAFIPMVELLLPEQSPTQEVYEKTLGSIVDYQAGEGKFRQRNAVIDSSPYQRAALAKRIFAQAKETLAAEDVDGAMGAISRQGLQDLLKQAGVADWEQKVRMLGFEMNSELGETRPIEAVISTLKNQVEQRTRPVQYISGGTGGMGVAVPRKPTARETQEAESLQKVIDKLERFQQPAGPHAPANPNIPLPEDDKRTSALDPTALRSAFSEALTPLVREIRELKATGQRNHAQDIAAMQQQTDAIARNRPRAMNPTDLLDRRNRGGIA